MSGDMFAHKPSESERLEIPNMSKYVVYKEIAENERSLCRAAPSGSKAELEPLTI